MEEVWTAGEGGEEGELFTGINFHNYSPPPGNIIYKAGGRGALHCNILLQTKVHQLLKIRRSNNKYKYIS